MSMEQRDNNNWEYRGGSWRKKPVVTVEVNPAATDNSIHIHSSSSRTRHRSSQHHHHKDSSVSMVVSGGESSSPPTIPTTFGLSPRKEHHQFSSREAATSTPETAPLSSPDLSDCETTLPRQQRRDSPPHPEQLQQQQHLDNNVVENKPKNNNNTRLVNPIPVEHIRCILNSFSSTTANEPVDLLRHVLRVEPSATDRQLRTAYFWRGRQVLGDHKTLEELSYSSKQTFQAVSMAYEILSTPSWRKVYEACNGDLLRVLRLPQLELPEPAAVAVAKLKNSNSTSATAAAAPADASSNDSTTFKTESILRNNYIGADGLDDAMSALSSCSSKKSSNRTIRWNENVEELVYQQHPEETEFKKSDIDETNDNMLEQHHDDDEQSHNDRKKKNKKKQRSVLVDAVELEKQLEMLDTSFMSQFFHHMETSLDGLEARFDDLVSYVSQGSDAELSPKAANHKQRSSPPPRSTTLVDKDDSSSFHYQATPTTHNKRQPQQRPDDDDAMISDHTQVLSVARDLFGQDPQDNHDYATTKSSIATDLLAPSGQPAEEENGSTEQVVEEGIDMDEQAAQDLFASLTKPAPTEYRNLAAQSMLLAEPDWIVPQEPQEKVLPNEELSSSVLLSNAFDADPFADLQGLEAIRSEDLPAEFNPLTFPPIAVSSSSSRGVEGIQVENDEAPPVGVTADVVAPVQMERPPKATYTSFAAAMNIDADVSKSTSSEEATPGTPDRSAKCEEDFISHLSVYMECIVKEIDKIGSQLGTQMRVNVQQGKVVGMSFLEAIVLTDDKVDGMLDAMKHNLPPDDDDTQPCVLPQNNSI